MARPTRKLPEAAAAPAFFCKIRSRPEPANVERTTPTTMIATARRITTPALEARSGPPLNTPEPFSSMGRVTPAAAPKVESTAPVSAAPIRSTQMP